MSKPEVFTLLRSGSIHFALTKSELTHLKSDPNRYRLLIVLSPTRIFFSPPGVLLEAVRLSLERRFSIIPDQEKDVCFKPSIFK